MAATATPSALSRARRVSWITPRGELLTPPRMTATAIRLLVQVCLVVYLWRGLYANTDSSAGLNETQAVGYAVLAVLANRIRGLDRRAGRDTVIQHLHFGTIVYWYLRPMKPQRYYALRALGDQLYGFGWVLAGYVLSLAVGVVAPPASPSVAGVFAVSMLLGQLVLYYVMMLVDLMCFWTLRNEAALMILVFAQNLLSGVYAPLWYFPDWFITLSAFLPFQATLGVPLSIYVGRIGIGDAFGQMAIQAVWIVLLALLTRRLWDLAGRRVVSQGG
ncbi:ABC transporter permease [Streptomyces europaeiscabiei]|uniref:ABC transporter permease n=1 Tax=Streptomyces europaeiscabiei TaxID=146819 RepID=UPI0029B83963|nr:ABC-2 family transporter protein [Streptomyces europaeiscabiei]MDX2522832.1 ABC-2 family transporter protein [Streptomyces europaeiscabiei]MDX3782027.1 ABC-2 family transporter protein [Streptomyces europaeiscabiei]